MHGEPCFKQYIIYFVIINADIKRPHLCLMQDPYSSKSSDQIIKSTRLLISLVLQIIFLYLLSVQSKLYWSSCWWWQRSFHEGDSRSIHLTNSCWARDVVAQIILRLDDTVISNWLESIFGGALLSTWCDLFYFRKWVISSGEYNKLWHSCIKGNNF